MARLLALEWDSREARVVVARRAGGSVVIERAFSIDLGGRTDSAADAEPDVGARLAEVLHRYHLGRTDTLVAVGRTNIELRLLSVPPAPADDLPDMVRLQAVRQFATLGDDWPLDYIPLPAAADGALSVLAAAISPELVEQISHTCDKAGLAPKRLVLRPVAAASLLARRGGDPRCRLMIEQLSDEADLTVLVGQDVVFMRTVRVGAHDDAQQQARWLLGEIRRTIAAAQNQLGGRGVEQIVLAGDGTSHAALKEQIESQLSLPVELFEPFAGLALDGDLARRLPPRPGSFAPLLGMLLDEAEGARHAIDFLHPRKRRPPVSRRRRIAVIAGCAAAAVVLIVTPLWWHYSSLGKRMHALNERKKSLDKRQKEATETIAKAEKLDKWLAADVTWLDELHYTSDRFPRGEDAIVRQLSAVARKSGGGALYIDAAATEASHIAIMETRLRSDRHDVQGSGMGTGDGQGAYRWLFGETIVIKAADSSVVATGGATDDADLTPVDMIDADSTQGDAADSDAMGDEAPSAESTDGDAASDASDDKSADTDASDDETSDTNEDGAALDGESSSDADEIPSDDGDGDGSRRGGSS